MRACSHTFTLTTLVPTGHTRGSNPLRVRVRVPNSVPVTKPVPVDTGTDPSRVWVRVSTGTPAGLPVQFPNNARFGLMCRLPGVLSVCRDHSRSCQWRASSGSTTDDTTRLTSPQVTCVCFWEAGSTETKYLSPLQSCSDAFQHIIMI